MTTPATPTRSALIAETAERYGLDLVLAAAMVDAAIRLAHPPTSEGQASANTAITYGSLPLHIPERVRLLVDLGRGGPALTFRTANIAVQVAASPSADSWRISVYRDGQEQLTPEPTYASTLHLARLIALIQFARQTSDVVHLDAPALPAWELGMFQDECLRRGINATDAIGEALTLWSNDSRNMPAGDAVRLDNLARDVENIYRLSPADATTVIHNEIENLATLHEWPTDRLFASRLHLTEWAADVVRHAIDLEHGDDDTRIIRGTHDDYAQVRADAADIDRWSIITFVNDNVHRRLQMSHHITYSFAEAKRAARTLLRLPFDERTNARPGQATPPHLSLTQGRSTLREHLTAVVATTTAENMAYAGENPDWKDLVANANAAVAYSKRYVDASAPDEGTEEAGAGSSANQEDSQND